MDLINRMENAISIADGLKPNEIIDGKVIYDLQLHLSEAMDLVKDLTIPIVVKRSICKKAGQCANAPGGLICPKNVECPI